MFKYFKAIFRGGLKILFAYPKIRRYAKHKDKYPIEERYAYARKLVKIAFHALDVKFDFYDIEKLPKDEPLMFVCNHQCFMDALTMIYFSEKPIVFVTKKEARKYPFAGKVIYFLDGIFMDRENIRDAVRMVRLCSNYLNDGRSVCIFPEGTRTRDIDHIPGEYKAGALKPAYEANKKIAYFVIDGGYTALSTKYKGKTTIKLKLIDIVDSNVYKNKTTAELAKEIEINTKKELISIRGM